MMADRWTPTNLGASRYIWLPMRVSPAPQSAAARKAAALKATAARKTTPGGPTPTTAAIKWSVAVRWHDAWNASVWAPPAQAPLPTPTKPVVVVDDPMRLEPV